MKFEETLSNGHLRKFLNCCEADFRNVMDHFVYGKSPYKLIRTLKLYIEKLDNNELITYERRKGFEEKFKGRLKPTYLDHSMLDEICKDHDTYDIEDCVLAILAWGQIRVSINNFIPAWKSLNKPEIKSFLEDIRIGRSCNRKEIYQKFTDYQLSRELKGINTPYFTKLIYFLMRGEARGYILDQFTAISANVLLKKNIRTKEIEIVNVNYPLSKETFVQIDKKKDRIEVTKNITRLFKKEIILNGVINKESSSIREILKFLRGTYFDPFGYLSERKNERKLVQDYKNIILEIGKKLNVNNYNIAVDIASFPDQIRGFGHVKEKNIKIAEECRNNLMNAFNESK